MLLLLGKNFTVTTFFLRLRRNMPLVIVLLLLALLYSTWFYHDRHWQAALLVFAFPPLCLLAGLLAGWPNAPLSAGIAALLWFSHGVMSAWTQPQHLLYAWLEMSLALTVVMLVSVPGLRARFKKRKHKQ